MAVIKIRQAKPLDASNLFRLLEEAHGEGGAYPQTDPHRGLEWITETLGNGYVVVADVSGRLVGSLALTNYRFPWSAEWYLYFEWLYVQKKFRKDGAFDALLTAGHAFADEKHAPILAGINSAGKRVQTKDRLIVMKGYTYIGGTFIRSQSDGRQQQQEN